MQFRLRGNFFFLFLFIISIIFAFQDWPETLKVIKDTFIAGISLFLFIGSDTNEEISKTEKAKQEKIESKTDHKTLKWFQYILLAIGISFNILYYFNDNLVIGIISVISLIYWMLTNLLQIFIFMYNYKKKS